MRINDAIWDKLEAENRTLKTTLNATNKLYESRGEYIAELEEELRTVNALLDMKREREQHWSDEAWRYKGLNEQLRAEMRVT